MSQATNTRFFKHYKNKPYKLLGIARHSETLEEMALYESLYDNKLGRLWVRPKEMFFENIEIDKVIKPRFEKVNFDFRISEVLPETELNKIKELYKVCFPRDVISEKFTSKLLRHQKFLFLTAYEGDQLVAFKFGYAQDRELFYSWCGAVRPEFQKLGLASELIELQHKWCRENGYIKIETRTRNNFMEMLRLNLKYGFKIIGTQTNYGDEIKIILEKTL